MLTSRGAAAIGAAVVLYPAGWLLGYPELCLLATGLVLALVAGAAWLGSAARLQVGREIAPKRIARGDPAVAVLRVRNAGRRTTRPFAGADQCDGHPVPVAVPGLGASAVSMSSYRLPTARRGEIPVGPLVLNRVDPFGFFRRVVDYGERQLLIVHPRTVPVPLLASGHVASLDGPDTDGAPGGTTTFDSLREYTAGDDLRHIHWRTSARVGTLMVRRLIDASEPRTTVLLDTWRQGYATNEELETAVDTAASVAVAAAVRGFPVRVLAGRDQLVTGRGRVGADTVLDLLALVRVGTTTLADELTRLPRAHRSGTLTVVTGAAAPAMLERVAAAAHGYERAIAVRVGSGMPAPPGAASLTVLDAASLGEFARVWHRRGRQ